MSRYMLFRGDIAGSPSSFCTPERMSREWGASGSAPAAKINYSSTYRYELLS